MNLSPSMLDAAMITAMDLGLIAAEDTPEKREQMRQVFAATLVEVDFYGLVGVAKELLETKYPESVFTGESGDPGPVFIARLRDAIINVEAVAGNPGIEKAVLKIAAQWDDEAQVWVATSNDVSGLVTEAGSIHELAQKLKKMVPELLIENGYPCDDGEVVFLLTSQSFVQTHLTLAGNIMREDIDILRTLAKK